MDMNSRLIAPTDGLMVRGHERPLEPVRGHPHRARSVQDTCGRQHMLSFTFDASERGTMHKPQILPRGYESQKRDHLSSGSVDTHRACPPVLRRTAHRREKTASQAPTRPCPRPRAEAGEGRESVLAAPVTMTKTSPLISKPDAIDGPCASAEASPRRSKDTKNGTKGRVARRWRAPGPSCDGRHCDR